MSDRIDPSQYGFTAGPADGTAALPSATIDTNQHQDNPDGAYATPVQMLDYPDHGNPQDLMSGRPGHFYTHDPAPTREFGQPFPFVTSQPIYFQDGWLAGYSLRETTGTAAALVNLRDGADASGKLLATIPLAAGAGAVQWFLPGGIGFARGLYLEVASGAVAGTAHIARTVTL